MTVYISEHAGDVAQGRWAVGPPLTTSTGLLLSYTLSSASTPTLPNSATMFVRVTTDTKCWFGFTLSTSASPAVNFTSTMTNMITLVAGAAAERIAVPIGLSSTGGTYRMWAASTST